MRGERRRVGGKVPRARFQGRENWGSEAGWPDRDGDLRPPVPEAGVLRAPRAEGKGPSDTKTSAPGG